jgi:hypothetical protein
MYASAEPSQRVDEMLNDSMSIFGWFGENWILIVLVIFGAIATGVIFALYKSRENERLERDSEGYKFRNQLVESMRLNADKTKIKKTYSFLNLLWLGIPFKWNEHSVKVVDIENKVIGWYRGESTEQNGMQSFLLYKTKSFIFFENEFILRFPRSIDIKYLHDKKTITKKINIYNDCVRILPNRDIKLLCVGVEKAGNYYFIPQFVIDLEDNRRVLDIRAEYENSIKDSYFQTGYNTLLQTFSEQSRKIVKLNPHARVKNEIGELVQNNEEVEVEKKEVA